MGPEEGSQSESGCKKRVRRRGTWLARLLPVEHRTMAQTSWGEQDRGREGKGARSKLTCFPLPPPSGLGHVLGPEVDTAQGMSTATGGSRTQAPQNHGPLLSQIHSCVYLNRKGHTERLSSALLQKHDFLPFLFCSLPKLSWLFLKKLLQHSYSAQADTVPSDPHALSTRSDTSSIIHYKCSCSDVTP